MLFLVYAGPNPDEGHLVYAEYVTIPFVDPNEWSAIILSQPVPVSAGQAYTWALAGGCALFVGNYPPPGFDSTLGPFFDFAFQTYVRPRPQSDLDGDGAGDACNTRPNTVPGVAVDAGGCPRLIPGDFGSFQRCYSGAGRGADPRCAD